MFLGHVVHADLAWPALNRTPGRHRHRVCSSKHNTALFLSSHPWKAAFHPLVSSPPLLRSLLLVIASSVPPSLAIVTCIMLWKPCAVLGWTTTWMWPIDWLTNTLWLPSMWTFSKTSPAHGQLAWCWLCRAAQGGSLLCWAATWWPSPWPNLEYVCLSPNTACCS